MRIKHAAEAGDYPELKRGAELAVMQSFGERGLLARAGLILGPHEDVGRLTTVLTDRATRYIYIGVRTTPTARRPRDGTDRQREP